MHTGIPGTGMTLHHTYATTTHHSLPAHTSDTPSRAHFSRYVEGLVSADYRPCQIHRKGRAGYHDKATGWLNSFMHVINTTFPHPGRCGAGLGMRGYPPVHLVSGCLPQRTGGGRG